VTGLLRYLAGSAAALVLLASLPAQAGGQLSDARRIVTLGGAITEIVHALGAQDRLAGRDSTSIYPPEAIALPDVGYMRALSPEGVLSIAPDGILAIEGSGPPEAVALLKAGAVPFVEIAENYSRNGILAKVRAVGAALGVEARAEELANEIDGEFRRAEEWAGQLTSRPKVLFVLSMQGGKIMAAGRDTAAAAIIDMAGGINLFAEFAGYRQVAEEAVIAAAPDVILMMDRAGDHAAADVELAAHPGIGPTPAGRDGRIVRMDGLTLLGFGPRTAQAVEQLAAALHPGTRPRVGQ
jgi:iron complex transport system substrate-binding protein